MEATLEALKQHQIRGEYPSTATRKYPQNVQKCRIMTSAFGIFSHFFSIFRSAKVVLEESPSIFEEGIDDGKILIEVIFGAVRQKVNKGKEILSLLNNSV